MKKPLKHPYYNFDKLFSYNATYNFVVGGRGLGKTYGAKKKSIANAINKGEQFIYLRRFKSEMIAKNTFFDDLIANGEFPEWDFRTTGNLAQFSGVEFRDEKKREWHTAGYFISLSTAQTQKSVAFPHVTTIIYDEFIIERGLTHYIPDEAKVFNNFYSTVDRWQDKTRVLFLANSVSIMNPYFLEYKIRPEKGDEWLIKNNGFVACHFAESSLFTESVMKTKFGRFIAETDYAEYAVGNQFSDNNDQLLQLKNDRARYHFTLQTPTGIFSVWRNDLSQNWYAQERRPRQEHIFVTSESLMAEGRQLLLRSDKLLQYLRTAFRRGTMFFDTPTTRNAMIDIFK